MTDMRELTIDELDIASGGGKVNTINMDFGLAQVSISYTKNCYGYAVMFDGPLQGGGGCPK